MKTFLIAPMAAVCVVSLAFVAHAEDLQAIEGDLARGIAQRLVTEAGRIQKPQITVEADAQKANGLHVPGKAGMLVVPQKDLKESDELAAKFKSEKGAPLAYLFLYHIAPVIDGKLVDSSKLRTVSITPDDGMERKVQVLLLAVKLIGEDDYRLQAYGSGDKPLVDVKFAGSPKDVTDPVSLSVKDANEATRRGTLVVTVFGKYAATFECGHQE